uniref:C2H2-type domain-containing protein n=1 Tax=Kryptolebias marmoratus TaxID=37003 RepID=A0A3Q3GW73_KRYMA
GATFSLIHLNPHSCTLCTKTFISSAHLTLHLASHGKERRFRCNTCGKFFHQSAHLIAHKTIHSGDRPFKCPECGKTFGRASHLKTHRRLHTGEKPFKCSYCDKSFTQKAGLLAHIRLHTGEKPYVCEKCGAGFRSLSLLLSHKAQEPDRTQSSTGDLKCGVCCRTFVRSSYIRLHIRLKKGQRPYHCKVCNKTFVKLDTFVNHCEKHLKQKREKNALKYKVVKPPMFVPLSRSTSPETSPAQSLSAEVNTLSSSPSTQTQGRPPAPAAPAPPLGPGAPSPPPRSRSASPAAWCTPPWSSPPQRTPAAPQTASNTKLLVPLFAPQFLSDLPQLYVPSRALRSADQLLLVVPKSKRRLKRRFQSLPPNCGTSCLYRSDRPTYFLFLNLLNTFLSSLAFNSI